MPSRRRPSTGFFAGSSVVKHHWGAVTDRDIHDPSLTPLFIGISYMVAEDKTVLAIAYHDHTYLVDFMIEHLPFKSSGLKKNDHIADFIIDAAREYEFDNNVKFVGAAMPSRLAEISPKLCARLWLDLDVVPIVIPYSPKSSRFWMNSEVDEQADSMARKCVANPKRSHVSEPPDPRTPEHPDLIPNHRFFGPSLAPLLQVGFRGVVMSDPTFKISMASLENNRSTCSDATWNSMMHYAKILKKNKIRIAFFSSTPQGGGVALMRHALRRFSLLVGVDLNWYVPKPRPGVFRSTKNMHNILQGVSQPGQRLSEDERDMISEWISHNAEGSWLSPGGPLRPVEEGGAHVIVVDDPQMPTLIPLIKILTPNRPVIFRSHIQIRGDLINLEGSPQREAWDFLWEGIRLSDLFISHPIPGFVPKEVGGDMVAYMPATTDWLDGLNKPISRWDSSYYFSLYNRECDSHRMTKLYYPDRSYIVQVARFDPAKGIPTVLDAYAEFRKLAKEAGLKAKDTPQLVLAANSSIDDPDAGMVFAEALNQVETKSPELLTDISIMRLQANDQLLNTLISHAHVVLQLSTREGFEVKVSEALHAGRPVIATRAGGIPIQVKEGENAFLVEPGDYRAVARHLLALFTDHGLWKRMSHAARTGVSDEVGTVGNALCWYYLAAQLAADEEAGVKTFAGDRRWVNDLARLEAGHPYQPGENRLPRRFTEIPIAGKPPADDGDVSPMGHS
ncbi:glycosyltransferase family 4 protein [Xylaria sp. CBS 124048]|nr:glycosyltransferase family 4 protein [Xylaria sp. CBS 124048]